MTILGAFSCMCLGLRRVKSGSAASRCHPAIRPQPLCTLLFEGCVRDSSIGAPRFTGGMVVVVVGGSGPSSQITFSRSYLSANGSRVAVDTTAGEGRYHVFQQALKQSLTCKINQECDWNLFENVIYSKASTTCNKR